MSKRDSVKLQEIAKDLDELVVRLDGVLAATSDLAAHATMIVSTNVPALTIFPTESADMARAVTLMDIGERVQKPAYAALAFRMAMIRKHQPDAALIPPAFTEMSPEMIGELHFLQEFILLTFNQEIDFYVGVEMASDCSGLVNTLLLTTIDTKNTYRTKVSGCSRELRSGISTFDLFDGVKYGSVLVSE